MDAWIISDLRRVAREIRLRASHRWTRAAETAILNGMSAFGQFLQLVGLIVAPIGMIHFFSTRQYLPVGAEAKLMTWELGCLFLGAAFFLLGRRLSGPSE